MMEQHAIHTEHSQKSTEKGIVLVDTYTKAKDAGPFQTEELVKLLSELLEKEGMTIQEIDGCCFDYWGYRKYHTYRNKEDVHEICDMPLGIDGYLMDDEMKYRFMYLDRDNKVIIAKCRKETGIDLRTVFDEETNRKAKGR